MLRSKLAFQEFLSGPNDEERFGAGDVVSQNEGLVFVLRLGRLPLAVLTQLVVRDRIGVRLALAADEPLNFVESRQRVKLLLLKEHSV